MGYAAFARCRNCNRYIYENPLNNKLCPQCSKGRFKSQLAPSAWMKCDVCKGTGDTALGSHKCLPCQGTGWRATRPQGL